MDVKRNTEKKEEKSQLISIILNTSSWMNQPLPYVSAEV